MCPTYNLVTQVSFCPELNWTNALQNRHWTPSHVSKRVSLFIWICTLPIPLQWLNDSWIFCLKASCLNMRNQRSGCCSSGFWQLPGHGLVHVKTALSTTAFLVTTYGGNWFMFWSGREWRCSVLVPVLLLLQPQLDGCVCQGGRPCSLMSAMPGHKPSSTDVRVYVNEWFFFSPFLQDGWSACVALTANQSASAQLTCWEAKHSQDKTIQKFLNPFKTLQSSFQLGA